MTGNNKDDLDKQQTMKMIWKIQMMMMANDIMKYINLYVFMRGNDDDLDKEQRTMMIWTMTTTTAKQQKEQE